MFLPVESIVTGKYALPFIVTTVFSDSPGLPGGIITSELESGIVERNSVELGTRNGVANSAKDFLSLKKVTECGSATVVGLFQITLSPALILIVSGTNATTKLEALPSPACTVFEVERLSKPD